MTSARARIVALFVVLALSSTASADMLSAMGAKANAQGAASDATNKKSAAMSSGSSASSMFQSLPAPKSGWTQTQIDEYESYIDVGYAYATDGGSCLDAGDSWFSSANGHMSSGDSDFSLVWYVAAENEYNIARKQYETNHIDTPGNDDAWLEYDTAKTDYDNAYTWYSMAMMYYYTH